jgi:hypothetical protein
MNSKFDLKEIERKAFRSTFQDGLWDIYMGLIIICMAMFMYRPPTGYSPVNIVLCLVMFCLVYGLFMAGKKFITLPRMGQVKFGEIRKRKMRSLAILMGIFVLFTAVLVVLTSLSWRAPGLGIRFPFPFREGGSTLPLVAGLGGLVVGGSMACWAFFSDFSRGLYIAALMTLAVVLMITFNQPVFPVIIGAVTITPGVVLLIKFLKAYPLPAAESHHD